MSLDEAFDKVRAFQQAFAHPAPDSPQLIPADRVAARADWLDEEVQEFRDAKNEHEQADAMIDLIYFALGGLVELGVRPARLFDIVHQANMAKLWPDGRPRFREDGKIIKPSNWRDPGEDLIAAIELQTRQAQSR